MKNAKIVKMPGNKHAGKKSEILQDIKLTALLRKAIKLTDRVRKFGG